MRVDEAIRLGHFLLDSQGSVQRSIGVCLVWKAHVGGTSSFQIGHILSPILSLSFLVQNLYRYIFLITSFSFLYRFLRRFLFDFIRLAFLSDTFPLDVPRVFDHFTPDFVEVLNAELSRLGFHDRLQVLARLVHHFV